MKTIENYKKKLDKNTIPTIHLCEDENKYEDLFDADPKCDHNIISASGGGIKCTKCFGWFCF